MFCMLCHVEEVGYKTLFSSMQAKHQSVLPSPDSSPTKKAISYHYMFFFCLHLSAFHSFLCCVCKAICFCVL